LLRDPGDADKYLDTPTRGEIAQFPHYCDAGAARPREDLENRLTRIHRAVSRIV